MRAAIIIAILLLGVITARTQDYYLSPAYYPTMQEIVPVWASNMVYSPITPTTPAPKYAGRGTWWQRNRKGLAITGIQLTSVILDAAGDAVYDTGKESHNDSQMAWGHTLQATAIGVMGVSVASLAWRGNVWDGVKFGVGWVAMRYAIHDLSYNLTRGIDPLYVDGLKAKMPPDGRVITQGLSFVLSVSINFIEF